MRLLFILIFTFFLTNIQSQISTRDSLGYKQFKYEQSPYGFGAYFQADVLPKDFNDFRDILKSYNVDLINMSRGSFIWCLKGRYKGYIVGLKFGLGTQGNYNHDSLKIEFNTTIYGISFGYNIINNYYLTLSPFVDLKWYRYRLLNGNKENEISLTDYMKDRDLDLRFNQALVIGGVNIEYKFHRDFIISYNYWTVGLYAGYVIKLNDKPLIYSKYNRLIYDGKINYYNINAGLYFSFNI